MNRWVVVSAWCLVACSESSLLSRGAQGSPSEELPPEPQPRKSCAPDAKGRAWTEGDACSCAPYGQVFGVAACDATDDTPRCVCGFPWSDENAALATWWLSKTGQTDDVLLDGARWSRVVQSGAQPQLSVELFGPTQRDWLPGSPNMLVVHETGDDSASFLVREFEKQPLRELRGEFAIEPGAGYFPRVVSLGFDEPQLVIFGTDVQKIWVQPMFDAEGRPNTRRWAAKLFGEPLDVRWMGAAWSVRLDDSGTHYQLEVRVGPYLTSDFLEEETGRSLESFQAASGTFSLSAPDAIHQLVIGHQSSPNAPSRETNLTGVVIERVLK